MLRTQTVNQWSTEKKEKRNEDEGWKTERSEEIKKKKKNGSKGKRSENRKMKKKTNTKEVHFLKK